MVWIRKMNFMIVNINIVFRSMRLEEIDKLMSEY